MNMHLPVASGLAVAVGAVALLAGACGKDGRDQAASHRSASPSVSASPVDAARALAGKPAAEILEAARAAFKGLKSVHLEGSTVDADGVAAFNITLGPDSARGSLTIPVKKKPVTMELIRLKDRAFVRSEDLWRTTYGNKAAKAMGHRWVLLHKFDDRIRTMSLTGMSSMFQPNGLVSLGGPKTVNGRPALALKDGAGNSLYIAADGKSVPLRIGEPGAKNWFSFTDHDEPFDSREPADFVDPKQAPPGL